MRKPNMRCYLDDEIHPNLYRKRVKATRMREAEEFIGGAILLAALAVVFTITQVAYGIW